MNAVFLQSREASDLALVKRAQSGEAAPFNQLVKKYRRRVVQIAMRHLNDPDDAEDVAQETFLRVYCALESFRGRSTFYTWLYRIAINTATTFRTLRSRVQGTYPLRSNELALASDGARGPADTATPEGWALSDELCGLLDAAIDNLPEDQRTAVMLRDLQGFSYQQVAVAMGSPVGTVRSRLSRARGAIDRKIDSRIHT